MNDSFEKRGLKKTFTLNSCILLILFGIWPPPTKNWQALAVYSVHQTYFIKFLYLDLTFSKLNWVLLLIQSFRPLKVYSLVLLRFILDLTHLNQQQQVTNARHEIPPLTFAGLLCALLTHFPQDMQRLCPKQGPFLYFYKGENS